MVTISHLAEKLISEKPFLQDALYRGIINYRALADDLVPKIEKELDWKPEETFESGIRKTVKWYLGNIDWCEAVTSNNYDLERLGTMK